MPQSEGGRTELCLWHHQLWYQQHAAVPAVHNEPWDPTTSCFPRPHQTHVHLLHRNECGQWGRVLRMAAFSPSPASHHFPNQQKGLVLAGDGERDLLAIQFPRGMFLCTFTPRTVIHLAHNTSFIPLSESPARIRGCVLLLQGQLLLQDLLSSPRSMLCCAAGRGPSPVLLTAGVTPYCASWGL